MTVCIRDYRALLRVYLLFSTRRVNVFNPIIIPFASSIQGPFGDAGAERDTDARGDVRRGRRGRRGERAPRARRRQPARARRRTRAQLLQVRRYIPRHVRRRVSRYV